MDVFNFIPVEYQALVFQIATIVSLALPLIERIVNLTDSKVDNQVFAVISKILGFIPRVTTPATQKESAPVVVISTPPAPKVEKLP